MDREVCATSLPRQHVSLGWGPHMCIGMHLARMGTIALNAVLDRSGESLRCSAAQHLSVPDEWAADNRKMGRRSEAPAAQPVRARITIG